MVDDSMMASPPGEGSIADGLFKQGMSRRGFLGFCSAIAAGLCLPETPFAQQIATALTTAKRLPVLWLNGQDCNGNIEALIRNDSPTPSELLLNQLSVNYVELLCSGAAEAAEKVKADTIAAGGYVLIVEGSIPTGANGMYCAVGGRPFTDIVREAASRAIKVISVGTCASYGGLPAARGGSTGAMSVSQFLGGNVINLPGCPVNPFNIVNTIVNYITLGQWPAMSSTGLPLFAYGSEIHERCPRHVHYEAGRYVRAWGDQGQQLGWCLKYMGCKGPSTDVNCPTKKFNGGTSFPISSGAPCIGCTKSGFWDNLPMGGSTSTSTPTPTGTATRTATPTPTSTRTATPTYTRTTSRHDD